MKTYGSKNQYHDHMYCPKCEGVNNITVEDNQELLTLECSTKCTECGHEDYWAYGYFQSVMDGEVK